MPNWVTNEVVIKSENPETIKNVKAFLDNSDDGCFDFEKIVPTPPSMDMVSGSLTNLAITAYLTNNCELENNDQLYEAVEYIYSGFGSVVKKAYDHTKKEIEKNGTDYLHEFSKDKHLTLFDAGNIYCTNILQYGCSDWYSFNCRYWGTKWNACEPYLVSCSDNELVYEFNTAWSMPYPIFERLSEMFKDIEISVDFADEDFGNNCGNYKFKNGVETDSYIPSDYKSGMEFAAKVLGYDLDNDFIYDEESGIYVWKD